MLHFRVANMTVLFFSEPQFFSKMAAISHECQILIKNTTIMSTLSDFNEHYFLCVLFDNYGDHDDVIESFRMPY